MKNVSDMNLSLETYLFKMFSWFNDCAVFGASWYVIGLLLHLHAFSVMVAEMLTSGLLSQVY